jgi:hypothetical protein
MRTIEISETGSWSIPDAHVVVPAYDLFIDHYDSTAADGDVDTLTVSAIEYKSVFYSGFARFYLGEKLKFNAVANITLTADIGEGVYFMIWCGVSRVGAQLPAVLFKEDNFFSIIPEGETPPSFCMESGGVEFEEDDTAGIEIDEVVGDFATVWLGVPETIPSTAKVVRVLPVCDEDIPVEFLLQNGETRTWFLRKKRTSSEFKELTKYNKTRYFDGNNESTYEISDGENEILTTLFISGLRKNELDEISQLAVSRYVNIDGIRAEIVRGSAIISGNIKGGNFSIDVKGEV